jgi:tetratricopeptide (TPR) repeat protein
MKRTTLMAGWLAAWLIVLALVGGCARPTPTPMLTATPEPTATPTPLPTATPTATPIPLAAWVAEGDAAGQRSDFAGAEATYKRAIDADPRYAPAYIALSRLYGWQMTRKDEALAPAQKAVELAPESALAWAALAEAYVGRSNPAEAVKAAEKAVKLAADNADVQAVLAEAYLVDRQYDPAYKAAVQAVKLAPQSPMAYFVLSDVHWIRADFTRARAATERAVSLWPRFAPGRVSLGMALVQLQLYEQAQKQFEEVQKIIPDYPAALLGLARMYLMQRQYDQAQPLIEKAAQLAPNALSPLILWSDLHVQQQEYEKAQAKAQEAIRLGTDPWTAQLQLGFVRLQSGDCESAASSFQTLSGEQPRFALARVGHGWARFCRGDTTRALELARQAADLEPYNSEVHSLLALLYRSQERWDEADQAFARAIQYSPVGAALQAEFGQTYLSQGQYGPAEAQFQLAARLDSHAESAISGQCVVYLTQNKNTKALTSCEQAWKMQPKNVDKRRQWGLALLRAGRAAEAVAILKEAIADKPEDSGSRFYLGQAYLLLKDYANAQKELETYKKLRQSDDAWLGMVIDALKQGFELREEKILADLVKWGNSQTDQPVAFRVEASGVTTRTLILSIRATADQKPKDAYERAAQLMGFAAAYGPRITPTLNGGATMQVKDARGGQWFSLHADAQQLRDRLIMLDTQDRFRSHLRFVQEGGKAETPELTDQWVKTTGEDVAKLRGLAAKTAIPFQRLKPAELEDRIGHSMDTQVSEATRPDELLFTLLGLIEPATKLAQAESKLARSEILGFYDSKQKSFYFAEGKAPGLMDRLTIAHEYVHGLQDQHFDIGRAREEEKNGDRQMAYLALIEGDAELTELIYGNEFLPALEMIQTFSLMRGGVEEETLADVPAFLRESFSFPYQQGLEFVAAVQETGDWAAVNDLYSKPPISTEQILHPERYRSGDAPVTVQLPDLAAVLGEGWKQLDSDTLGEFGWRLILTKHIGPGPAAVAADGWGGDSYSLLQQGSSFAAVLRIVWDKETEAEQFWALLRKGLDLRPGYSEVVQDLIGEARTRSWRGADAIWTARLAGKAVTVVIGPTEEAAQKLLDAVKE